MAGENNIPKEMERALSKWKTKAVKSMRDALRKGGKSASRMYSKLTSNSRKKQGGAEAVISVPDYGKYVDSGRKRGKMPPVESVREWCARKKIDADAAWPIAVSISRKGLKPVPFMKYARDTKELVRDVTAMVSDEVSKSISEEFKNKK